MPVINNMSASENIPTIFHNRPIWSTFDTEKYLLLEDDKITVNNQKISSKDQKRPKWPSYKIE